ncbi:NAD(+) diphosphatase [Promethearchaeum syntrophicum]|uniref:NAD(+) diphosphatase n=1 Tax=Promethearchaeum syntrophicum TaxID=2594042 RepID=A0A5B9DBP2_9ARCH|nr:NAD(+) diphosphatase [Candidatus Prometheoarchaeum syntrophicum]QEE16564.1 ADP-ribose pyrophosphatase [Candidatus Prometheoarchaeum syntrophicum]
MVKDFIFCSKILSLDKLSNIESNSLVFLFQNNKILALNNESEQKIPSFFFETKSSKWKFKILPILQKIDQSNWNGIEFGKYKSKPTYLLYFTNNSINSLQNEKNLQNELSFLQEYPLRSLIRLDPGYNLLIAGIAYHVYTWISNHIYCGRCGKRFIYSLAEFALKCPSCNNTEYPHISPAVIIAIIKDNKILLAHNKQFPTNLYSLIAGFVDPGENLEEAISREVKEEIGISICNISYFASQPWPFPNSLMLAFTADWAEGEISVDKKEIMDAQWFGLDNLPKLPSSISVARNLIDHFVQQFSS